MDAFVFLATNRMLSKSRYNIFSCMYVWEWTRDRNIVKKRKYHLVYVLHAIFMVNYAIQFWLSSYFWLMVANSDSIRISTLNCRFVRQILIDKKHEMLMKTIRLRFLIKHLLFFLFYHLYLLYVHFLWIGNYIMICLCILHTHYAAQ